MIKIKIEKWTYWFKLKVCEKAYSLDGSEKWHVGFLISCPVFHISQRSVPYWHGIYGFWDDKTNSN